MSSKTGNILVIDDDPDVLTTARMILRPHYSEVQTENSPKKLLRILKDSSIDVIILDMNFKPGATSGNEGLFWLKEILKTDPEAHVIMNTAYGDINLAVECMKNGAIDFLVKPWERQKLLVTVQNVFQMKQSRREISSLRKALNADMDKQHDALLYDSPVMDQLYTQVQKVSGTDANVLILGENGTGKEVVAREIHRLSDRRDQPFIKVDLGALSPELIASELFGHVKGAFTDAKEDRTGRFELANKGTLFLDEIGNIPPSDQVKLLSVLQNRTIYRVGDHQPIPVDIRLLSATNMPLDEMTSNGNFRDDLLYRINTVEIQLPPLRERTEDIPVLAVHFLKKYKTKYRKPQLELSKEALQKMSKYGWPGNVRELQHAIERAVIMTDGNEIGADDLVKNKVQQRSQKLTTLKVDDIEKEAIIQAIRKHEGNLSNAAKELGMGRTTLYRKIERYNIQS